MIITEQESQIEAGSVIATNSEPGIYKAQFMFTKVANYVISVQYGGQQIKGSPVDNVKVFHSDVMAFYSELLDE